MEGNQMKMREAVVALLDTLDSLGCDESTATLAAFVPDMSDSSARCLAAFRKAKEALSSPPRNCDIGTVQERHRRFLTFCNAHVDCIDCPIKAHWTKALSCGILWDQMPYEAEEGGAK